MTKPKPKPKPKPPDDEEQSRRFIEKARELEADETGRGFEKALESVRVPETKNPPPRKRGAGKQAKPV